jgi:hypothetical protein
MFKVISQFCQICVTGMPHFMAVRSVKGSFPSRSSDAITGQISLDQRATGIEPAWPAWKAGTLPLSYARVFGASPAGVKLT